MYCPTCGSEERQLSQYCRSCGTDIRAVRISLERPDSITESAISARDQIGRAIADKIRMTESAGELKTVAEEVLPEIEKFLESPAEKRLRRLRAGMILSFIGIGTGLGGVVASLVDTELFVLVIPGLILLFIGLGIMLNGLVFTIPRRQIPEQEKTLDSEQRRSALKPADVAANTPTNERDQPDRVASVTEHTTHQLRTDR